MAKITKEDKLKYVMEAADECWHEFGKVGFGGSCLNGCGCHDSRTQNPSPDDLNELFRLAEKACDYFVVDSNSCATVSIEGKEYRFAYINNTAKALLNALFIATGGEEP